MCSSDLLADAGQVSVRVIGKDSGNLSANADFVLSASTNQSPTGTVTINGTVTQYQTVTASNTLSDPDGNGTLTSATYQWQSSADNGATWTNVATGPSLTLTSETLVGRPLRVVAQYTDGLGTPESIPSASQSVANVNDAPAITSGGTATIAENQPANTLVYQTVATDPDAGTVLDRKSTRLNSSH